MRRLVTYIVVVMIVIVLLIIGFVFKNKNTNNEIEENKTIQEQVVDVLSIDESDKNIIGYITIDKIGLEKAPIADGTDNKTINKYVGHFDNTSYLEGNVCLCSHNRGSAASYFGELKNLKIGDEITYITKYETKKYRVEEIKKINEADLSVLEQTEENKITLITCIENQRKLRLCVVGVEIGE